MTTWRKSARCDSSACVETSLPQRGEADDHVMMRDSRGDQSPVLLFDALSWSTFIDAVKAGQFDR
jgi:Domain of unknown function (DUF397)